ACTDREHITVAPTAPARRALWLNDREQRGGTAPSGGDLSGVSRSAPSAPLRGRREGGTLNCAPSADTVAGGAATFTPRPLARRCRRRAQPSPWGEGAAVPGAAG